IVPDSIFDTFNRSPASCLIKIDTSKTFDSITFCFSVRFSFIPSKILETYIVITVRDEGAGIKDEHLKSVFEPYNIGEQKIINKEQGAGLGLYIVKSIVRAHGGNIDIESKLGKGTKISIKIPIG
ncbi:MAG: ATP-binding protein, partial [Candidatus Omnitrophica bacterium]|nr:ATP-binding protein [Candidatus Omnitrophota bacterium]